MATEATNHGIERISVTLRSITTETSLVGCLDLGTQITDTSVNIPSIWLSIDYFPVSSIASGALFGSLNFIGATVHPTADDFKGQIFSDDPSVVDEFTRGISSVPVIAHVEHSSSVEEFEYEAWPIPWISTSSKIGRMSGKAENNSLLAHYGSCPNSEEIYFDIPGFPESLAAKFYGNSREHPEYEITTKFEVIENRLVIFDTVNCGFTETTTSGIDLWHCDRKSPLD